MPTSTSNTSKRHSLAISTGPKPLHLVAGAPLTAPHTTATFSAHSPPYSPALSTPGARNQRQNHKARRQSSISYVTSPDAAGSVAGGSRHAALSRSNSVLQRQVRDGEGKKGDRRSVLSATGTEERERKQRPPLTLAEKHADLLHFIAQKESKCLELRSQLAVHETELLQLKRKWERIVNRGFERDNSSSSPYSPSTQGIAGLASPALVEGIKGGVQGMSRLLASGLVSTPTPSTSSPSTAYPLSPSPSPSPTPLIRTHQPKPSTSTASSSSYTTSASKSTRFSLSSASSIGEVYKDEFQEEREREEEDVLIMRDTGATPTMSPNPDWVRERKKRKEQQCMGVDAGEEEIPRLSLSSQEHSEDDTFTSAMTRKTLRRRSGGVVAPLVLDDSEMQQDPSVSPTEEKVKERERKEKERKRASVAMSFPPVSSIPGLGSLATTTGASAGWVESMGKKFGELKGGAGFSKSQKRASLLISDVSQSFFSALSSPSANSVIPVSSTPSAFTSFPSSLASSTTSSPAFGSSSLKPSTPSTNRSQPSLLDDDDDFASTSISPVLQPSPALTPPMVPTRSAALSAGRVKGGVLGRQGQEEEEEWNW